MVDATHRAIIREGLALLGRGDDPVHSHEVLRGGISGAATYRIRLAEGDAVLKITLASAAPAVRERAARELAFYRELARRAPLRVPRLLASCSAGGATALLMAAYEASPAPEHWRDADFIEIAEQLGRFHAAFWDAPDRLSASPWLRRPPADRAAEIAQARALWRALGADARFAAVVDGEALAWLEGVLARLGAVRPYLEELPLTLCHGDCHSGNVLRDAGGAWVWADWQEARLGHGPEDLSFFFQRAAFAGAAIPYAAATAAYHARLAEGTGAAPPPSVLERALDAADLWSRLVDWPAYLSWGPARQCGELLLRVRALAARLGL